MKGLHIFVLCLCFSACMDRNVVPSGIIQPDSMRVILKDVIMVDQYALQYLFKDSVKKDSSHRNVKLEIRQLYETVFKLHTVTRDEFRKSLDFYDSRPDLIKTMFDSLAAYETRHRNDLYKPNSTLIPSPNDALKK